MRHNLQNLLVRPPFYDALSGEFIPQSDPDKRHHTMARLAFKAYAKGEHQSAEIASNGKRMFSRRYEPIWAPGVIATAYAKNDGNACRLLAVGLHAPGDRQLIVQDTSTSNGFSLDIATGTADSVRLNYLDEFHETTRRAVAEAAKVFFNSVGS